jgi:capsule polysaccharide modification protein KpsS
MAKIIVTIQATNAKLDTYAVDQGYLDIVAIGADPDGTTIVGANPQSKQDYLASVIQKTVARKLSKVRTDAIDAQIRDQRVADKLAAEAAVDADVSVAIV